MQSIPNLDEGELNHKFSHYFDFQTVLGNGSFGLVVAAKDKKTRELVAVKVVKKEQTEYLHEHLRNEGKILSQFNHRNIVKYKRVIETDMRLLLVMECINGGRLSQKMHDVHKKGQKFTEEQVSVIIKAITEGVAYLHLRDTIHRDLKPENILLADADDLSSVKIIDFGLAGQYNIEINTTMSFSERWGTKIYMAPEMFHKKGYGKPIDIWSIGIIMFKLLNDGRHPFYDKSDDKLELYQQKIMVPFTPPSHLSELAKHLLSSLLQIDSSKRYTASTILSHPWITRNLNHKLPLTTEQKLEVYQQKQTLIRVIKSIMFAKIVDKYDRLETSKKPLLKSEIYTKKNESHAQEYINMPLQNQNIPTQDQNRPTLDQNRPTQDPNRPTLDQNRPIQDQNRPTQDQNRSASAISRDGVTQNKDLLISSTIQGSKHDFKSSPILRNSRETTPENSPILPRLDLRTRDATPPIIRENKFYNYHTSRFLEMAGRLDPASDDSIRKNRATNVTAMLFKHHAASLNHSFQVESANSSEGNSHHGEESNMSSIDNKNEMNPQFLRRHKSKSQTHLQQVAEMSSFNPERIKQRVQEAYFPDKTKQENDHDESFLDTSAVINNQTRLRNTSLPKINCRNLAKVLYPVQSASYVQTFNQSTAQNVDSSVASTFKNYPTQASAKRLSFSKIISSEKKVYPINGPYYRAATIKNDEPEKHVIKIVEVRATRASIAGNNRKSMSPALPFVRQSKNLL